MKLTKDMKIVCICRGGQVRSVAARFILADKHGFRKVLACGWEKNDTATLNMLVEWADAVLLVGSTDKWKMLFCDSFAQGSGKRIYPLNIGEDRWGHYQHQELINILTPMIEGLLW